MSTDDRHLIFLVHGRCDCGWQCACLEGAVWPQCPNCGRQVLPPAPNLDGVTEAERENGRQGYYRATEQEALREARDRGYLYLPGTMRIRG
jgi:hypothetical protein